MYKYEIENELKELKDIPLVKFEKRVNEELANIQKGIISSKGYFCTNCQKWHKVDKRLKRGDKIKCECGAKLELQHCNNVVKDVEKYLTDISLNKRKELIIRIFYLLITYNKKEMKFSTRIVEVERINNEHSICMKSNTYLPMGYYSGIKHNFGKSDFKRDRTDWWKFYPTNLIITKNIAKTFKNSKWKYHRFDLIAKYKIDLIDYIVSYNNTLETLLKCGGHKFVKTYLNTYNSRFYAYRFDFSDRWSISRICKNNFTINEFSLYRIFGDEADAKTIRLMSKINYYPKQHMDITGEIDFKRHKKTAEYLSKYEINQIDYLDYIKWVKELKVPMDTKTRYPKKFKEAHDNMMEQYETLKNKKIDEGIMEQAKEMERFNLFGRKYCIFVATSQAELVAESQALHHCVRSYAKDVSKKKKAIFFIREVKQKDVPLATLELTNKRIVQCRIKGNERPEESVIKFVNRWANKNKFESCFI